MMNASTIRPIRLFAILATTLLLAGGADAMRAQDSSLRAERVVDFELGKALPISAKVGPVSIQSVEFSDRGRPAGGIVGIVRTPVSETSTVLRGHFLAENATRDEWEVTFTIEFLDGSGKLIDRATKKSSWEGQAKPTDLDHPILQYLVPVIAKVRIKMEGRLD